MTGETRYIGFDTDTWYISGVKGDLDAGNGWTLQDPDPWGDYTPQGTYTGTATVEAII